MQGSFGFGSHGVMPAGNARVPAWWADTNVNAYGAYRIIQNRFKKHGSQSEIC